jgi:hypothetical protein
MSEALAFTLLRRYRGAQSHEDRQAIYAEVRAAREQAHREHAHAAEQVDALVRVEDALDRLLGP